VNPTQPCVVSHAPKQAPNPPLYTGTVRNDGEELSLAHLTRYDSPRGSVKTESHAGFPSGMGDALAEATELIAELLDPELVTDEDEGMVKEPLPAWVVEVDEGDATTEEEVDEVALAEEDDPGKPVELGELVGAIDERLVDVDADPEVEEVEVTEAVTEFEVEEVTSLSSSSVMVAVSSPPIDVETGVSSYSSEEVELDLVLDVMLADGVPMIMEVTLVELGLTAADNDVVEDDSVVVVVVVGPMEVLLPGTRLR
jgi:hypothetical protein